MFMAPDIGDPPFLSDHPTSTHSLSGGGGHASGGSNCAHESALVEELVNFLDPIEGGVYVDATMGSGGHSEAIIERTGGACTIIGIDMDAGALALAEARLAGHDVRLFQGSFAQLPRILASEGIPGVHGLIADLGISSAQIDNHNRGFSYQDPPGPLDMRFDTSSGPTVLELLRSCDQATLKRILKDYGEVPRAGEVARRILASVSTIETTTDLARLIDAMGWRSRRQSLARLAFQALRVHLNSELDSLASLLDRLPEPLLPGGRVVVLSYESVSDRMVKRRLAALATGCICPPDLPVCGCGRAPCLGLLTPRPVRPSSEEVTRNPRSRAAKLRAAQRLPAAETGATAKEVL